MSHHVHCTLPGPGPCLFFAMGCHSSKEARGADEPRVNPENKLRQSRRSALKHKGELSTTTTSRDDARDDRQQRQARRSGQEDDSEEEMDSADDERRPR